MLNIIINVIVSISFNSEILGKLDDLQRSLVFVGRSEIIRQVYEVLYMKRSKRRNLIVWEIIYIGTHNECWCNFCVFLATMARHAANVFQTLRYSVPNALSCQTGTAPDQSIA